MKTANINRVFDAVMQKHGDKNDAALGRRLRLSPQFICNVRHGRVKVTSTTVLAVHEHGGLAVKTIRAMLADTGGEVSP